MDISKKESTTNVKESQSRPVLGRKHLMTAPTKIKVVHLTSVHPSADIRIFHKECRTLAAAGYEVVLIVPSDRSEVTDDVQIRHVAIPSCRVERMLRTVVQVSRASIEEDAQVYHFHDPELIPVGVLLKLRGKRVIYDVHDHLSESILIKTYIPHVVRGLVAWLAEITECLTSKLFDVIVTATPALAKRFPERKTVIVQNYPVLGEFKSIKACPYVDRAPLLAYVGTISAVRGIKEMVQAVATLPRALEAKLVLAGSFSPASLESEVKKMDGWERVKFLGWQARTNVLDLLAQARIGLVLYHPELCHVEAQPNKLFEYMSAGIPVVASDFPLWRHIVGKIGCGILVDPLKPTSVADAVQWLLDNAKEAQKMGLRGRRAVKEYFNWNHEARKLLAVYKDLLSVGSA